jgi:hypothetical protein
MTGPRKLKLATTGKMDAILSNGKIENIILPLLMKQTNLYLLNLLLPNLKN